MQEIKPPDPQLVLLAEKQQQVAVVLPPADIKMPATPGGSRKRGGGRSTNRKSSVGPTPPAAAAPLPSAVQSAIAASATAQPSVSGMQAPTPGRISAQAFAGPGPYMQSGVWFICAYRVTLLCLFVYQFV
jgi:hypothetical protein